MRLLPLKKGDTMPVNEQELAMALRGGLRGRFQNSFHLLENAFEVLNDQMVHCVTPAQYDDLRPLLRQIEEQLILLRRLGEHSADAAVAPVLHRICTPRPMELLGTLREWANLFNDLSVQEQVRATACVETTEGLQMLLTMGDDTLLAGLLANLISNSLAAGQPVQITLACAPGLFCYRDNGPGLAEDAKALLQDGQWSQRLLEQGGLGLPLIRAYAQAMGWKISIPEGAESCLQFALPPCTMEMGEMVLESAAVAPQVRQRRRLFLQRELYPALLQRTDDEKSE